MRQVLTPQALTAAAFAPFGELIEARPEPLLINEGTTERHHALAAVTVGEGEGIINLFRAQPRSLPMRITMMERHPLGSQAFLPTDDSPYLVLVCLGDKEPDPSTLALFIAQGVGVNYRAGCWHHPLLALDTVSDFWVVDRRGTGNNLEEVWFDPDTIIELPDPRR
ncbi:ureidoglycolate lyase [Bacterioplanes sanyensis]|uniref:Ureidoglycolate lyase n=1 Tax=Bacterioplanes sanyensis TaxID=1249553 RepID=A0A222FFT2_9GAMM|nr:ureidoglycolate lyase [Bacterioplanes sanyensis]ASP37354.1 ureidoglycolate lyase [Bacterioplanes sanyensis]